MSKVGGKLHNLCQKIQSTGDALSKETWNAYSHHYVTISPNNTRSQSRASSTSQTSQRASISPQKQRKTFSATLQSWTLYLCQTIDGIQGRRAQEDNGADEDSDTESEGDNREMITTLIVWYQACFHLESATALSKELEEDSWTTLELRLRVAWDGGYMDILGDESERRTDGSFSTVKLSFDSKDGEATGVKESNQTKIDIELKRLSEKEALRAASMVSSELAHAFNNLKSQTDSLKQERDSHRKLLQNNRRHERFREANSSLVNPGRLKRKTVDDEGFEGDDDDDEL